MNILACIVIGAGQNGLYTARKLQQKGLDYRLLDRDCVGDVWRKRLNGMVLFTSRQFCSLPGLTFPGDQQGFPSVIEMADYLQAYAKKMQLNILEQCNVEQLSREGALFKVSLSDGQTLWAKSVVDATGSNQVPKIPEISQNLSEDVLQLDATLPSIADVPAGSQVVVVGSGATGRQIAGALSQTSHVTLSTGSKRGLPPNTVLGKDLFWWLKKLGILFADKESAVARLLQKRNPVPCADFNNKRLRKMGVNIVERTVKCAGNELYFNDGGKKQVDVVIWCSGYRDNVQWIALPDCVNDNGYVHEYGVTPQSGFFIVGRKWLSCRASELVMGVEKDVEHIMAELDHYLSTECVADA